MIWWLRKLLPARQKNDPSITELTGEIHTATVHLEEVSAVLANNVSSMEKEQVKMNRVLDEALSLMKSKEKKKGGKVK